MSYGKEKREWLGAGWRRPKASGQVVPNPWGLEGGSGRQGCTPGLGRVCMESESAYQKTEVDRKMQS